MYVHLRFRSEAVEGYIYYAHLTPPLVTTASASVSHFLMYLTLIDIIWVVWVTGEFMYL